MMKKTKQVRTVQVPLGLIKSIQTVVRYRLGYVTIAEYVRQAIREKLKQDHWQIEELEKRTEEQKKAAEAYEKLGLGE